ncbi:hypothetical protein M8C21_009570, partial [Ambrosia artemisiifolia]
VTVVNGNNVDRLLTERNEIRLGLPSKGRMASDTLDLLKDCQLSVRQTNPRQYVADIPQALTFLSVQYESVGLLECGYGGAGGSERGLWRCQNIGMWAMVEPCWNVGASAMDEPSTIELRSAYAVNAPSDSMSQQICHPPTHKRAKKLTVIPVIIADLEVWFQRPKDIVRKLLSGDLDLGIVGLDTFSEFGQGNEDLIIVHDALAFGDCRLSLAIPNYGVFENINSLKELAQMPLWTAERPLRVATGFTHLGPKFLKENGLQHVTFSTADGALEAAPAMGIADAIVDLVSSGTTLKENNLKEIEGGVLLESQGIMVASKKSLMQRKGLLDITHEILERFEAHLKALDQFTVVANMRGTSEEEVAERILSQPSLSGLQGPTISPVFRKVDGAVTPDFYAIVICVPKKKLYKSVQQLRAAWPGPGQPDFVLTLEALIAFCFPSMFAQIGGSGVLVSPLTYIFDEETPRWNELLSKLGL